MTTEVLSGSKVCTKCGEERPLGDFNRRSGTKDGYEYRCKLCASAYYKTWRKKNVDKLREYQKSWRDLNREYLSESGKAWYEANRDDISARRKVRHSERWIAEPEYRAKFEAACRRRNRMLTEAKSEPYTREAIFDRDGWVCGICNEAIDPNTRWPSTLCATIDHIVPLILGGDDTPDNVQSAHGYCNFSKNCRTEGQES